MRLLHAVLFFAAAAVFTSPIGLAQTPVPRTHPSLREVERGPHHRWVDSAQSPNAGRYVLLANGLHFTNALGQLQVAAPVIQDFGGFIVCTGAAYRVVFNANLNTYGAVDLCPSDQFMRLI